MPLLGDLSADAMGHLTDSITHLLTTSNSLGIAIKDEIRSAFIPKWTVKQTPALDVLQSCCQLLHMYSAADLIILMVQNPDIANSIIKRLLQLISKWKTHYNSNSQYVVKALRAINIWFYGWFLQANNIEILQEYDASIYSNKIQSCCEQGNFVELAFQFASVEQAEQLKVFLDQQEFDSFSVKSVVGLNSAHYVHNTASLRECLEEAKDKMMFVEDLPNTNSAWFVVSLGMNYSRVSEFFEFVFNNHSLFASNLFLVLELLYEQTSVQSFLHGVLQKVMPIDLWKSLLKPFVTGVFASGLITKEEVAVLTHYLCISDKQLRECLERAVLLDTLLPCLFASDV